MLISGLALCLIAGGGAAAQGPGASPATGNPFAATGAVPGSGAGRTIGYLASDPPDPWSELVTQGVLEEAAIAGVTLVTCADVSLAGDARSCAVELRKRSVEGVLNGQAGADRSRTICAAYGELPTVAIDRVQPPCALTFVAADGDAAGRLAGEAVGTAVLGSKGCDYDLVVAIDAGGDAPPGDRVGGLLDGFAGVCGEPDPALVRRVSPGGDAEGIDSAVAAGLGSVPDGGLMVILAADDAVGLDALDTAGRLGRDGAVRIAALGAAPAAWPAIACHPSWVADAGLFPERYGRTLIPAVLALLDGQPVPSLLPTPIAVVNAANIRSYYPDLPAC